MFKSAQVCAFYILYPFKYPTHHYKPLTSIETHSGTQSPSYQASGQTIQAY